MYFAAFSAPATKPVPSPTPRWCPRTPVPDFPAHIMASPWTPKDGYLLAIPPSARAYLDDLITCFAREEPYAGPETGSGVQLYIDEFLRRGLKDIHPVETKDASTQTDEHRAFEPASSSNQPASSSASYVLASSERRIKHSRCRDWMHPHDLMMKRRFGSTQRERE